MLQALIYVRCCLYQLLHNLVVVAVLAVDFSVVHRSILFALKQVDIKLVDLPGVGPQHLVAILVNPNIENGGEEFGVSLLHLLLVRFGGLIQVVFDAVADNQQVDKQFLELLQSPSGSGHLSGVGVFVVVFLIILVLLLNAVLPSRFNDFDWEFAIF